MCGSIVISKGVIFMPNQHEKIAEFPMKQKKKRGGGSRSGSPESLQTKVPYDFFQ